MDAETRAEVISIIKEFKETKMPPPHDTANPYYGTRMGFGMFRPRVVDAPAVEELLDKILGLLGADDKPALNL